MFSWQSAKPARPTSFRSEAMEPWTTRHSSTKGTLVGRRWPIWLREREPTRCWARPSSSRVVGLCGARLALRRRGFAKQGVCPDVRSRPATRFRPQAPKAWGLYVAAVRSSAPVVVCWPIHRADAVFAPSFACVGYRWLCMATISPGQPVRGFFWLHCSEARPGEYSLLFRRKYFLNTDLIN